MAEKMQILLGVLMPVLNDPTTDLPTKIDRIVNNYIDMLIKHPDLPIFVLSEIHNNPERFATQMQVRTVMLESVFVKQLQEAKPDTHPLQILMNTMGMIIFPFIGRPIFQAVGGLDKEQYIGLMNQRKTLIPAGVKVMLNLT
jgi:hypothetical protein